MSSTTSQTATVIDFTDSCLAEFFAADARRTVDPWDMASMDAALAETKAANARRCAALAEERIAAGARHIDVMGALAAAEEHTAGTTAHAWHAARTDAYAAQYGLKGWYRDAAGRVHVNLIRTAADGQRGRHFIHRPAKGGEYWVVDRDTHRTAHRAASEVLAQAWITDHESARHTDPAVRLVAAAGLRTHTRTAA